MNPRKRRLLKLQAKLNEEKLQLQKEEAALPTEESTPAKRRRRTKKVVSVVADNEALQARHLDASDLPEE